MNLLWKNSPLSKIAEKVYANERITQEDAIQLLKSNELNLIGLLADHVRKKTCGDRVCYSTYLNINHTNLCYLNCQLCAFYRKPGDSDAYILTLDEIEERVRKAYETYHINEVHIVGGLTYEVSFDYIKEMLERIKVINPDIFIKAFTTVEIDHFARQTKTTHTEVLETLKASGLGGLPGGGAEIFSERIRGKIAKGKLSADKWLEIMRKAHQVGLGSNATMLYGHIENEEDIADHINRLREVQDETNGFNAFIPLAFHPDNTEMDDIPFVDGMTDLKIYAVSRIFLDNFPHIKAFWTTLGKKMAQVSLSFGVDDLGGMAIDEKIMHDAGAKTPVFMKQDELVTMIETTGRAAKLVNSSYKE